MTTTQPASPSDQAEMLKCLAAYADPGQTDKPTYPREIPRDVERAAYAIVGSAWKLLERYRTLDGPHDADGEIVTRFLLALHQLQPDFADEIARATDFMIAGAAVVASECGPQGDHWADWGKPPSQRT